MPGKSSGAYLFGQTARNTDAEHVAVYFSLLYPRAFAPAAAALTRELINFSIYDATWWAFSRVFFAAVFGGGEESGRNSSGSFFLVSQ